MYYNNNSRVTKQTTGIQWNQQPNRDTVPTCGSENALTRPIDRLLCTLANSRVAFTLNVGLMSDLSTRWESGSKFQELEHILVPQIQSNPLKTETQINTATIFRRVCNLLLTEPCVDTQTNMFRDILFIDLKLVRSFRTNPHKDNLCILLIQSAVA